MEQRHLQEWMVPGRGRGDVKQHHAGRRAVVLSVVRDITQRKQDEARLKSLLAQQEAILNNALVGISAAQAARDHPVQTPFWRSCSIMEKAR